MYAVLGQVDMLFRWSCLVECVWFWISPASAHFLLVKGFSTIN